VNVRFSVLHVLSRERIFRLTGVTPRREYSE
jgi:hypothetical protein